MLLFNLSRCRKPAWNWGHRSSSVGPPATPFETGPVESTLTRFHRPWTELRVIPFCLCLPAITMPTGGFELQQLFPNKMELLGYCICLPPGKCTSVEIWKSSGGGSNFTKWHFLRPCYFVSVWTEQTVAHVFIHRDLGFFPPGRNSLY